MNMDEIIEYCKQEGITVEEYFRLYIGCIDYNDCL